MDQLDLIYKIRGEFLDIVNRNFPEHFLRGEGSSGPDFHAYFAKENLYFENTDYYYKGDLQFFHLTNYRSLFSILNSRTIRLYNLHKSNDPTEFEYSANLFNASPIDIDSRKKKIYSFSFCPMSELTNQNSWEIYGDNFRGIAIIFQIINNPQEWDNFHMSDIKYDLSPKVKNYVNDINTLKIKYAGCTFELELEKIMAFHKEPKWEHEKEIRILTYNPFPSYEDSRKFSKQELIIEPNRNRFAEYFDLHLWVKNDSTYIRNRFEQELPVEDYFIKFPQIKIKDILFGGNCGLSPHEFNRYISEIELIIAYNFGYNVHLNVNLFNI